MYGSINPDAVPDAVKGMDAARAAFEAANGQRASAEVRVKQAQQGLADAEQRLLQAEDGVITGDTSDSLAQIRLLNDAKGKLAAAQLVLDHSGRAIEDSRGGLQRAERRVHLAAVQTALQTSVAALPALEDAVTTLMTAYNAVRDAHADARRHFQQLMPGQPLSFPAFSLSQWVLARMQRDGFEVWDVNPHAYQVPNFDLAEPVFAVTQTLQSHADRMRESDAKAAA